MQKLPLPDDQPIAVNALRNKRSDIAGQIQMHEREIDRLRSALVHVDATLLLFDPATDPEAIAPRLRHPQRLHYFAPGEQTRRVFDAIRVYGTVSAGELVDAAMVEKGFPATDRQVRREFVARFTRTLDAQRRRGKLAKIGHGPGVRFRLAPREAELI